MSLICVSIGRGRHRATIAEYAHLAQQGAQLVELRLDCIQTRINLQRLLAERPCPAIITIRRVRDGGHWKGSEADRIMLLRQAIAMGVDYVDLEDDIAAGIPRFGKTKRIVSLHNFLETPADLEGIHAKLAAMNADVVKIATMSHTPADNLRMLRLVQNSTVPTVGLCMGDMGIPTRILGGKFGAPFSFATFHADRALAPGQQTFQQMRDVFRYESIGPDTEVYGVIADPVGHSLSPLIHNAGFKAHKLNKVYLPLRVPREHLAQFLANCPELGIKGLSVTIPHKEEILKLVAKCDEASKHIQAANTVVFKPEGAIAYNTDYRAAMSSIDNIFLIKHNPEALAGKTCLMLGAGGVARAIVYGLKERHADVVITSRTLERAEELAKEFNCKSIAWNLRHTVSPALIVNGTPIGMHPNVDETPFDPFYHRSDCAVFDTVYNPEQTLLIKQARDAGCETATGVDMFVRQAALQYKLFTGEDLPLESAAQLVRRAISAAKV